MANVDLDALIRKLAKQQNKSLMAAVKASKTRHMALAAKAKNADGKQRYRQLAKDAVEIGTATVKRLQMSADNAADSYARAIRQAMEASAAAKPKPAKKVDAKSPGKAEAKKAANTTKKKG